MAELKNALRSGDVSVSGSRQFRAFEEYLMPHTEFDERLANGSLHLAVSTSAAAYLDAGLSLLVLLSVRNIPFVEVCPYGPRVPFWR